MDFYKSLSLLFYASVTLAQITIYGQTPLGQVSTASAPWATTTVPAAYNDTRLNPPPIPNPPINGYTMQLQSSAAAVPGLSIPHASVSFFGFSIEMSVITQVVAKNSTHIQVPFLNLMANLQERAGGVFVRLGGNTQEFAALVDPDHDILEPGHTFGKTKSGTTQTTETPAVLYTLDMFYLANNISSFVNVKWFFGIPFNDSVNWRTQIAQEGEQIMSDNIAGYQVGNEPDFYVEFGRRQAPYGPGDYHREVGELIKVLDADPKIKNSKKLVGPSISNQLWTPQMVWDTNFIPDFADHLAYLCVEHYPMDNCAAMFNTGGQINNPQDMIGRYLDHGQVVTLVQPYESSTTLATQAGKQFIMFETNTASCGGFPGISDTFVSALWGLDYGFRMAHANFTHAFIHVGGQNVFYNPFTAEPTADIGFNQWTLGPIYYSTLIIAEAFGKTNTSQIIDMGANENNAKTPAYAIYENGILSKVALFNLVEDPSGASNLNVALTVQGNVPASVKVKYLLADGLSDKNNITWAGQTFGKKRSVDGRLRGDLNVTSINCDTGANICRIPVPAPGFALVFFSSSDPALTIAQSPHTFTTTAWIKPHNTVTVLAKEVELSNGHNGSQRIGLGRTSYGQLKAESGTAPSRIQRGLVPVIAALVALLVAGSSAFL